MKIYCREENMSYSSGLASFDVIGYTAVIDDRTAEDLLRVERTLFRDKPFPGTKPNVERPARRSRRRVSN